MEEKTGLLKINNVIYAPESHAPKSKCYQHRHETKIFTFETFTKFLTNTVMVKSTSWLHSILSVYWYDDLVPMRYHPCQMRPVEMAVVTLKQISRRSE